MDELLKLGLKSSNTLGEIEIWKLLIIAFRKYMYDVPRHARDGPEIPTEWKVLV